MTWQTQAGSPNVYQYYFSYDNASGNTFAGNGTSGVYLFGAQLEYGVTTDYIATTSAAVSVGPVANVPRLDYLGSSCPRLLLEPQRTNDHAIGNSTVAVGGGESATFSAFLKAAERNWAALRLYTGSGSKFAYFNLSNGTLGSVDSGATATIVSYGNGWYRCSITITMVSVSISLPYVYASVGDGMRYYAGTTGSGIYCWGFQHEKAAYATSYIGPTLAAAVTRGVDSCSKTGISSLIGQTEGTLFAEIDFNGTGFGTDNDLFIYVGNGSNTDAIYIDYYNNLFRFVVFTGVSLTAYFDIATTNGTHKIALAYKSGSYAAYVDGVQIGVDAAVANPPTCSTRSIFH
jgi:hypothetical protein